MLITILAITVALVAWSLHLMQEAMDRREFSLMLAGTLVAFSAAALVAVYFLMGNYIGYMAQMAHRANHTEESVQIWISQLERMEGDEAYPVPMSELAMPSQFQFMGDSL